MKFSSSALLLISLSTTAQSQGVDPGFGVDPPGFGGVDPGFSVDPIIDPSFSVDPPNFEKPDFDLPKIEKPDFDLPKIEKPDIDPDFGVDLPDAGDIDPDFGVNLPDAGDIDPDFGADPNDIDPDFGVDPEVDPGFGADPNDIDPDFGVDPEVDPGFGVDPEIDPGFGVEPEVDPGFGVDPPTDAPAIDPDFGVDPLTDSPTPEPTDATTEMLVGGGEDEYGCIPSAGYTWCATSEECYRPFEAPCDTVLLGDEGGNGLLPGWTLFEPFANAKLETENGDCTPTNGEYIHANLEYMQGVNIECDNDDKSTYCRPLYPTTFEDGSTNDKWLVTNFVLATPTRECPNEGAPLTDSLGVQFYAKDDNGDRSISSKPAFFGRLEDTRGTATTTGDAGTYYYESCVKVPMNCQDDSSSFAGWTGISYQNRPLAANDCNGPIDLYIDSIVVSSECPLNVNDDKNLDADEFCNADQVFQTDLGVCDTASPTGAPSPFAEIDNSFKDVSDPTPSDFTASAPSDAPKPVGDADDLAALDPNPFPTIGSSASSSGAGISVTRSIMVAVTGILVAATW